ncbi:glutamic acid-rich protein-like [Clytia hemisphaerica]|uniref:Cnidarian restricted protein n=1 Tax=Clytia hemisphaerica TaxID=252671 RepID=A0A7M5UDK5_9CNID
MIPINLLVKLITTFIILQHFECIKHHVSRKSVEGRHKIPTVSKNSKSNLLKIVNKTKIVNETLSNKEFNNTKRWLESSYSRGFHSSNSLEDSSLDSNSLYEYKTDSRQNFLTGNNDESYGSDIDAFLKPGIGDYPSDMDGLDDSLKMYGAETSHHQTPSNTAAFSSSSLHSTGTSSLDDTMLTDLLSKNIEPSEGSKTEKGENLQKFASPLESNSNSASIVSDAINQDEVSPAKVIDNALTNIEQEAAKLIKESKNTHGSGSGDTEETTSSLTVDLSKTKGETKEGDVTSAMLSHSDDASKALKEATQNAPEDDSVTLLSDSKEVASGSGVGDLSSETNTKQGKEVKISKMFKAEEKDKHKTNVKHVKGTRRQEDSIYQIDPMYSEGYDVDSAVKTYQVSPKLVSSISQAIKGMDEEETGVKLGNEAVSMEAEKGAMLPSEQQNTKSFNGIQQQQNEIHTNPSKQSRFEENENKMYANEAPIHGKETGEVNFVQKEHGKESETKEKESESEDEANKTHNKKQTKFHEKKKEEEDTSKMKNEKGHKVTKASKEQHHQKEKKVSEEDNFNHQSPSEPVEENQKSKEGESSAENNDGGDLLEDNLMKMDKKKLVKLLAKFMRDSKKKTDDSEKNHQTPAGGNGGGMQATLGLHPLLLGAMGGGGHKASGDKGSQFVYMNELPSKAIKVDQPSEEELTEKSTSSKVDHDPYVDIGSSDPTDGDKAVQSHNRQKVTSSKDEKSGGSDDKEEKEEKGSKEDEKEKETTEVGKEKNDAKFSKEDSKEDGGKTNEAKVNESKEDDEKEASETKEDTKVSESKEDAKVSEAKEDAKVGETKEEDKSSESKEDDKASEAKEDAKVSETEQDEQEKAQHLISGQTLLKDEKEKEESEKSEGDDQVVASLSKSKEEDSKDEHDLVNKIMEKEKTYTSKLAADIHQHLSSDSSDPNNEDDSAGNKGAEKNSEALSADEAEQLSSSKDENIKKLIQKIKEKLESKKTKKHHGQTANHYDDVYAEIGSFGKRDHGIVKKSFKRHRHVF